MEAQGKEVVDLVKEKEKEEEGIRILSCYK